GLLPDNRATPRPEVRPMPEPTRSIAPHDQPGSGPPAPGQTADVDDPTAGPETPAASASIPPMQAGRYELLGEIARGGMGIISRATDTVLGREVAVKVLREQFGPASAAARRFADEARIAAQLQHPGIPAVHDLGTLTDGRLFLAMKLIK